MGFFDNLLGAVNQLAGVGENITRSLDTNIANAPLGGTATFGQLGDFATKIDRSANRSYVETGFIRNLIPRQAEILMQEPDLTVLIKKQMFSSLVENYKPELMDADEKLFYRASKKLFQNKCAAISAYERLTKIDRVIGANGVIDDFLFPVVFAAMDTLNGLGVSIFDNKTQSVMDTLRKVKNLSEVNYRTTWITESDIPAVSDLGDGTGVFEITNVSSVSTTTSTKFGGGSASMEIEDPYQLMRIFPKDIEQAIRESAGGFINNAFFRVTEAQLERSTNDLRTQLGQIRRARGATAIRFRVNEDTLLFRRVRAIIDEEGRDIKFSYDGGLAGIGGSVDVDDSAFEGRNGLSNANGEADMFKQIISNIYLLMGMKKTTENINFQYNRQTNYVRRRMMQQFNGRCIIQPMDIVHVYISTKTILDSKTATAVSNSFVGEAIFNALNDTIANIENIASSFSGENGNQGPAVVEKNAIAGPNFPMWLWNVVRNDFTRQAAGTHVFAGVVEKASHRGTAQDGKYVCSVTMADNCTYFGMSQININPSVDVFNGAIYDPLTPLELDFDPVSGFLQGGDPPLLPENIKLLNSGLVKFNNGRFRGYPANDQIFASYEIEKVRQSADVSAVRRVYNDPDGFVYRWKQGIQSLTLMGEPHPTGEFPGDNTAPNIMKDPFAGQDVMNVLSLLVTGLPYNYNTFMRAAISSGSFSRDDLLNESSSGSFFKGLISDISKQNSTWGNFIPFKKLILNESAYAFLRTGEVDMVTANQKISQKLRERAQRFDQLVTVAPMFANNPQALNVDANGNLSAGDDVVDGVVTGLGSSSISDTTAILKLTSDVLSLDFEIQQLTNKFTDLAKSPNLNTSGGIQIFGDDVSFDPSVNTSQSDVTPEDMARSRNEFRKQINYLTQRRLWQVKANEDSNLFIVDDSYDKNYDIQAFEQSLAGSLELFKSEYTKPADKIQMVAQLLGLEVFADSQGHIQARPPQYNRMPSSVFHQMITAKDTTGIQLFPPYLEGLFINQVTGLGEKIEILEDEIRLRAAVIGFVTDQSAKTLLSGFVAGGGGTNFGFVTQENTGKIGGKDLRVLFSQVDPDAVGLERSSRLKSIGNSLQNLSTTLESVSAGVNFDIVQRVNVVNKTSFKAGLDAQIESRLTDIGARLQAKTGVPAPTKTQLLSSASLNQEQSHTQLDRLNVTEAIAKLLSERQSAIKMMRNAVKNLEEGVKINSSNEPGVTAMLPFINKSKSLPSILEHMIEDEDVDDFGYRSGKRYVIKENQIISFQTTEEPPPYTMVQVDGLFDQTLGTEGSNAGVDTGGGNFLSTAWAVDFDLWRMYGFRGSQTVPAPFLSNPDTQCAPYAVFLLNKARKEILQAEIQITGNEFIQAGEVYYIEGHDMLYYAETVSHSFSYGSGYTTTIQLRYGHNPGEYIPTILDVIGKGLYTKKHQADLSRHNRYGSSSGDMHLGCVVFDKYYELDSPVKSLVSGAYGDQNRKVLGNVVLATSGILGPQTDERKAKIELRVYHAGGGANAVLQDVATSIGEWLRDPTQTAITEDGGLLPSYGPQDIGVPPLNDDALQEVDLSDKSEPRSPSPAAINKARELVATGAITSITSQEQEEVIQSGIQAESARLQEALFTKVIDIWVTYDSVPLANDVTPTTASNQSEDAQKKFAKALADFQKQVQSKIG